MIPVHSSFIARVFLASRSTVLPLSALLLLSSCSQTSDEDPCAELLSCCKALAPALQPQCQSAYDQWHEHPEAEEQCQKAADALAGQCGSGGDSAVPAAADSGVSEGGAVAGSAGLKVHRAAQSSALNSGAVKPLQAGTLFISVDLELTNNGPQVAPLVVTLFSLRTAAGLEFAGDPQTVTHPHGCPQNASVTPGQSTRCVIVFSLPETAQATSLSYSTVDGKQAETALAVEPCVPCEGACVDVGGDDPENCGACGARVGLGSCVDGAPVCEGSATLCSGACVDLMNDPMHCGTCNMAITFEMTCVKGERRCTAQNTMACGAACLDIWHQERCGGCDRPCGDTADCKLLTSTSSAGTSSEFFCEFETGAPRSCAQICGSRGCKESRGRYDCYSDHGFFEIPCHVPPPSQLHHPTRSEMCYWFSSGFQCTCN